MFDIELVNFNPEAPSFLVMLITALLAFFLSSIIAVTYEYTTKSIYRKAHFLQSLALIGVVAATILQAMGRVWPSDWVLSVPYRLFVSERP